MTRAKSRGASPADSSSAGPASSPATPAATNEASPAATREIGPLPEGTRLLHIGPHKTGTTALQGALYNARPALLAQGVRHAGPGRNPTQAVRAVVGQASPYGSKAPSIRTWDGLVREIRGRTEPRLIVSCEIFAWADEVAIRRIVADLDPERVQVAVTLRSLARVIPSMWQQNVQAGTVAPFDDWLREILAEDRGRRPFWTLQRHDELLERWAGVVGRDRVIAVVVDDRDHGRLLRSFEGLLGLKADTLVGERDVMNRSLTLPEAEAVRAFNQAFNVERLPRDLHARTMRFGAAQLMKQRVPPADEAPVALPSWAVDQVAAIQQEVVANVAASGIRVVGDLESLAAPAPALAPATATAPRRGTNGPADESVPADVAASMAMGVLVTTGAVRSAAVSRGPFRFAEPVEVARVPTYQLLGAIAGRAWRATVGRVVGGLISRRGPKLPPAADRRED